MMQNGEKKILVIVSTWPSREHPYITCLISGLKEKFPYLQLFLFRKSSEEYGVELVGKEKLQLLLNDALYRFVFSYNPLYYFVPLLTILRNLRQSLRIYFKARDIGYNVYQAFGQLIYNHQLLGTHYDLVYINALQSARHFFLSGFFANEVIVASSRGQDFDFDPTGYDKVLNQLDHLHVLGEYLKEKAIKRGFNPKDITVIPPSYLPHKKPDIKLKESDAFTITSVSRVVWTKGYRYMLRAVALLLQETLSPKIIYQIVGDGADMEFVKNETERLGIKENVKFLGWQSQEKVNEVLVLSDVYLHLSIEEGFNNAVLNAQSLGIPCVVSNTGGLPENVLKDHTGFVVPAYDPEAAFLAIKKLLKDSALRHRIGNNAKSRAKNKFGLNLQIENYAHMFSKAAIKGE